MYRIMRYIVNMETSGFRPGFLTAPAWVCYMLSSMVTQKRATSVRLSDEARSLMEQLAAAFGISRTAVLEQALRRWARAEGISQAPFAGETAAPRRKTRDGKARVGGNKTR